MVRRQLSDGAAWGLIYVTSSSLFYM